MIGTDFSLVELSARFLIHLTWLLYINTVVDFGCYTKKETYETSKRFSFPDHVSQLN